MQFIVVFFDVPFVVSAHYISFDFYLNNNLIIKSLP
jgi:hypothetical protein